MPNQCTVSAFLWLWSLIISCTSAFYSRFKQIKRLQSGYSIFIHIQYRFSWNNLHFSETENRCNSIVFPHSSNCHNVCTAEQTFASITSVCFHNKYSYIIRHVSGSAGLASMQIVTQKESHVTSRGESVSLSGEMSTNETSIKLWWHTSILQHTSWSPLSFFLKWQRDRDGYAGVGMIWHSVRKTHFVFQSHIA